MDADHRELDMAKWPLIEIEDTLWHTGFMDPARKGTGSYEGHGLSVSRDPDDWRRIARLSGEDWVLEKPGHRFLDIHELTDKQKATIFDWAIERGLLEQITIYEAVQWDSEFECETATLHYTYEDALKELPVFQRGDQWVWDNIDETPLEPGEFDDMIRESDGHVATPELIAMMKASGDDVMGRLAEEYAIIAYAEQVLDLDGVWWEDDHDPSKLSAPRGVIFPGKLASWTVKRAAEHEAERQNAPSL